MYTIQSFLFHLPLLAVRKLILSLDVLEIYFLVEQCVAICVIPVKCIYLNAACDKLQRPFNPQKQHISVPGN
jgi:hypothetical protein